MALIKRFSRLFHADMHAVLDRLEEPDVLLKHAIREMEEWLETEQQRFKRSSMEQQQLHTRQTELEHSLATWEQELDLCFNAGKIDLARALVKRKLEGQQLQKQLTQKRASLQTRLETLQIQLNENRERLEEMKQKAALLCTNEADSAEANERIYPHFTISADDVEVAFLREQQQRNKP